MPPKKRVAVGGAKPVAVAAISDKRKTIRIRVEKFSKIKESVKSEVKEIGGFPWQLEVVPSTGPKGTTLWLNCLYSTKARVWHCKAERKWRIMDTKGEMHEVVEQGNQKELFVPFRPDQMVRSVMDKIKNEAKKYVKNDTIEIEVEIHVEQEARDRFRKKLAINFLAPSEMFDSELSVGGKTIYVNKQFLSMHSSVFKDHFYGDSNQKLELEDMDAQALIEFLKMLYRAENSVTAANAEDVLFMADKFKTQCLVDHAEKFLFYTGAVKPSERIRIAEKFNLPTLMRGALLVVEQSFTVGEEVLDSASYKNFSAKTKKAVADAMDKAPVRRGEYDDSDEMSDDDMDGYAFFI